MSRRIDYYDDIDAPRRVAPQAAIRETKEETGIALGVEVGRISVKRPARTMA